MSKFFTKVIWPSCSNPFCNFAEQRIVFRVLIITKFIFIRKSGEIPLLSIVSSSKVICFIYLGVDAPPMSPPSDFDSFYSFSIGINSKIWFTCYICLPTKGGAFLKSYKSVFLSGLSSWSYFMSRTLTIEIWFASLSFTNFYKVKKSVCKNSRSLFGYRIPTKTRSWTLPNSWEKIELSSLSAGSKIS